MKQCKKCREEKPQEEFNKDRTRKDGLDKKCRECTSKRMRALGKKKENKEKRNLIQKTKYKENQQYRIKVNARNKLNTILRGGLTENQVKDEVGCSRTELKQWIENQFEEWMTWQNRGPKGWAIDHRIPFIAFDLTDQEQKRKCTNYTNIRPVSWKENCKKAWRDRWGDKEQE